MNLQTLVAVTSNPICQVMSHHDVSFELSKSYAIFFFPAKRVILSIFSAKCLLQRKFNGLKSIAAVVAQWLLPPTEIRSSDPTNW